MSADSSGGPAFPYVGDRGDRIENAPGMSLRDYFAAAALQALMTRARGDDSGLRHMARVDAARECYAWADAMLEARES